MRFVKHDESYYLKKNEKTLLFLLDKNTRPTPDFIKLLAAKIQHLVIQTKIRKDAE